jgi:cytochrome c peroxidase
MRSTIIAVTVASISIYTPIARATIDDLLRKVIEAYTLTAYKAPEVHFGPKERLGQALFFDPFVSGPKNIACAACHVRSLGAGDGLPVAIGVGGRGVGQRRLTEGAGFVVPRNAMPLFNRGAPDFTAFFWDGKVERGAGGWFESPLGRQLPSGFDSLLAVASVMPLAAPDEMLGHGADAGEGAYHRDLVGRGVDPDNSQARTLSVFRNVARRLLAPDTEPPDPVVRRYRVLFRAAYPNVALSKFDIAHVGNALAAYITVAFALKPAAWDRYVEGDRSALTSDQKRGALVFYGKGRCVVCHAGREFSDFQFHGLAIPQGTVGPSGPYLDYGRASATSRGEDRFKFRTPPLRNVTRTGPWGHNGAFASLEAIIRHHVDPVPGLFHAEQGVPSGENETGRLLGARSSILADMPPLSKTDFADLVQFLTALSSPTVLTDTEALPSGVPSASNQFVRK